MGLRGRERSIRFAPPAVAFTPALRWVLARAFGPVEQGIDPPPAGEGYTLAKRLGLAARIASRVPRELLAAEVGAEAVLSFHRDRVAAVAVEMADQGVLRELAAAAESCGIPLAFLKSTALRLGDFLAPGSRPSADLDVLAPEEEVQRFQSVLCSRGFEPSKAPEMEHQLPTLQHPSGRAVEVHRMLLGVRINGQGRSARLSDLDAAGLLRALPELSPAAFMPAPEVLAAHALVHALVQHGWAPHAYPALRLPADLADLGILAAGREGAWARAGELAATEVSAAERAAIADLVRALAGGELAELADPGSGKGVLLHHFLAGLLQDGYGESLRFRLLAQPLSDLPRSHARWRSVIGALFPPRSVLEAVYGSGGGRLRRVGLRLARPFDLARRAWRYRAAGRSLAVR